MDSPQAISELAIAGLVPAEAGTDPWVFADGKLEELQQRLSAVPSGEPKKQAIIELVYVVVFLTHQQASPNTAKQLGDLLEAVALPEVTAAAVDKTDERVGTLAKKFDQFQGSRGESLPDTGERLDPKLLKRPIRG